LPALSRFDLIMPVNLCLLQRQHSLVCDFFLYLARVKLDRPKSEFRVPPALYFAPGFRKSCQPVGKFPLKKLAEKPPPGKREKPGKRRCS
jgi:hypothetical protein